MTTTSDGYEKEKEEYRAQYEKEKNELTTKILIRLTDEQITKLVSELDKLSDEVANKKTELELLREMKDRLLKKGWAGYGNFWPKVYQQGHDPAAIQAHYGYETGWSWYRKARFVLTEAGHGLTMRQILQAIYELEPSLKRIGQLKELQRKHTGALSPQLNQAALRAELIREKDRNTGEFVIYLAEWADETGQIKPEFKKSLA